MSFHAHRYKDPHIGWWVKQIPGYDGRKSGFAALLYEDELPAKVPTDLPNSRVFKGVGWAGLHSDITRPQSDTCMIFKSSPYGSVSHSHADQNAFAIMRGGAALAIPSGYYGPSYGKPHHAQWTRSTKANNCILVNGQGQKIRSAEANGAIVDFKDAPGYSYVAGDATAAYVGRLNKCVRHDPFKVQLKHTHGWFGAIATGDFGQVEGWIRTDETRGIRPSSFAEDNVDRQINLWGRTRDGEVYYV